MISFLTGNKKIILILFMGLAFLFLGLMLKNEESFEKINSPASPSLNPEKEKTAEKDVNKRYVFITKVIDGDTVETNKGERIRYIGINAPEKGQPKSTESFSLNKNMILNKEVGLEYDVQGKDRYGRTLAYVYVYSDSSKADLFVNFEMVKRGLAVSETIQPNVKHQDEFVNAQRESREICLGIWEGLCVEPKNTSAGESQSCIHIYSINADAVGDDNKNKNGEWVQINNRCNENVFMNNWLIKDNSASNEYRFKDFVLEGGKNVFLYSGCGTDSKEKLYWKCPEGKYAIWNNSADHAYLYNKEDELVSDFGY